ncbi:MAG: PleD family two-component system response regulator [Thiohalospira sp.]
MNLNKKILIIDDDTISLTIIKKLLCSSFQLLMAENAYQALKIIDKNNAPDLIIVDIHLPGINGVELIKTLKTMEKVKSASIIVISGLDDEHYKSTLKNMGVENILLKPIDRESFKKLVKNILV